MRGNSDIELFPNTDDGIRAAVAATPIDGFWEDRVDWFGEPTNEDVVTSERLALLAVAKLAKVSPELFTPSELGKLGLELGLRGMHVPGIPVDLSEIECVMGPTEASWASWKCGGGPHREESEQNIIVRTKYKETIRRPMIVPYTGTETDSDGAFPHALPAQWRNLPA